MKTLEYSALTNTFTQKECNKLVRPIHDTVFPKARICRNISYDLRYGASDALGLGLHDLFHTQGIDKFVFYSENIRSSGMSGPILWANLEWALIHKGIGHSSLFNLDYNKYGHLLPRSWIKSLWEFTHMHNISIPPKQHHIRLKREKDAFLMDSFLKAGFSKTAMKKLNRCQLFLHVETLSDITDGSGRHLDDRYLKGLWDPYRTDSHDWPVQTKPDKPSWALWRKAVKRCFPTQGHGNLQCLVTPLGKWTDNKANQ